MQATSRPLSTEGYGAVRLLPGDGTPVQQHHPSDFGNGRTSSASGTIRRRRGRPGGAGAGGRPQPTGSRRGYADDADGTAAAAADAHDDDDPAVDDDASRRKRGDYGDGRHRPKRGPTQPRHNLHDDDFDEDGGMSMSTCLSFRHDVPVAILALPPLLCAPLFVVGGDATILVTCVVTLSTYLFDLSDVRDGCLASIWMGFLATSCTALVASLVVDDGGGGGASSFDEAEDWGLDHVHMGGWGILRAVAFVLLIFCLACWATLQFQWLTTDLGGDTSRLMERMLLRTLPAVSTCLVTYVGVVLAAHWCGTDVASRAAPYLAATCLCLSIRLVSGLPTSFPPNGGRRIAAEFDDTRGGGGGDGDDVGDDDGGRRTRRRHDMKRRVDGMMVLSRANGRVLSSLLLLLPPLLHVASVTPSASSSWDDACDLVLVVSVPWLLHGHLVRSGAVWWWGGGGTGGGERGSRLSAALARLLGGGGGDGGGGNGPAAITIAAILAAAAFQERYVKGPCSAIASSLRGGRGGIRADGDGGEASSSMATSALLAGASASLWGAWKLSTTPDSSSPSRRRWRPWPWRGTATDADDYGSTLTSSGADVLSLLLVSTSSLCLSAACGVPRIGGASVAAMASSLTLFVRTGSPRYMGFSVAMACALLWPAVHGGMGRDWRDDCLPVIAGVPMLAVAIGAMAAERRAPEGDGSTLATTTAAAATSAVNVANSRRKLDLAGTSLVAYASVVCMSENIFLGDRTSSSSSSTPTLSDLYYGATLVSVTSALLVAITGRLWWYTGSITKAFAAATASVAVGKLAVLLGGGGGGLGGGGVEGITDRAAATLRVAASSLLLFTILAPYAFFEPTVPASAPTWWRRRGGRVDRRNSSVLPEGAPRAVAVYHLIVLPIVIVISLSTLLLPSLGGSASSFATAVLGTFSGSLCLWGLCTVVSTMVFLLPRGGADRLMRIAVAMALLGVAIIASYLVSGGRIQNVTVQSFLGSLGLVVSFLSCYVAAIVGQTCPRTNKKSALAISDPALKRLVICGALFGSGLALFVSVQNMEGASTAAAVLTVTSSVFVSICGGTAIVLGHYLNLVYFDGAILRIAQVCTWAFAVSSLVMVSMSSWMDDASMSGEWFSTYLIVCFALLTGLSVGLRCRSEKSLNTRKLGNASCVLAWGISLLLVYFRHGISGFDTEVLRRRLFGVPMSVVWTFVVSSVLLLLDGSPPVRNTQTFRLSSQASNVIITRQKLTRANRWAPLVGGTAAVFVIVSLYSICLRGCSTSLGLFRSGADVEKIVLGNAGPEAIQMQLVTQTHEEIDSMARRNFVDGGVIRISERFDGSCFCTAGSVFGPLLHLAGTFAVLPSLVLLVLHMWNRSRQSPALIVALLPLNLFCLVLCKGIPSLVAAAIIGLFGGIYHLESTRRNQWKNLMKI